MTDNPVNEALQKKAERGEIELIDPLDYRILETLTPEGTTQSGLYPIGTVVKQIASNLGIDSNMVSGRVRIMSVLGFATKIQALGGKNKFAWQRTAKGDAELKAWKERQNG